MQIEFENEDMSWWIMMLEMLGKLFMICDDFRVYYLVKMNE
jgi:hypothetical protein